MRQFKATQSTPQGPLSLHVRFIGKYIFMHGQNSSKDYVNNIIKQMRTKGAVIQQGNGGWMRVDIIKDIPVVKLGDYQIIQDEMSDEEIEEVLMAFYSKKYAEAKFVIQEIVE